MKSTIGSRGSWKRMSPKEPRTSSAGSPGDRPAFKILHRRSRKDPLLDALLKLRRSLFSGLIYEAKLNDGSVKTYFKKGALGDRGREMMRGTFESEKTLYSFAPNNVPKPLAWGTYKAEPDKHFYMCDFYEMTDDLPEIQSFCTIVAKIHLDSMGKSPDGKCGFQVTTHLAYVDNDNSWSDSWEQWYARALKRMLEEEEKSHGPDDELASLTAAIFEKVVPRLLKPLETGGRQIQPCLIHSDLWPGNVKPDAVTGEPIIFDSSAFWGHNEGLLHPSALDTILRLTSQQRTSDHGELLVTGSAART
ncbi:MAG: hypothetical protein Q9166_004699 [cf. Caloplaca sp. 2 TL-2023]